MSTALVTGATSGIGEHFAQRLAADGYNLVIVARTTSRLEELATQIRRDDHVEVEVLAADLSRITDCRRVERRLKDPGRPVDLVVNNAGFGLYGDDFAEHDIDDEDQLVLVNVRAVMRLTHAALGPMLHRGTGDIINVSSVASFAPDAVAPTYAASKAWVTSFSQGLREQVSGSGVRIMALAPGLVPTGFQDRAGVEAHVPDGLWLDVDAVVDTALNDLRAGHGVSIPGLPYRAVSLAMRYMPRRVYLPLSNTVLRRLT